MERAEKRMALPEAELRCSSAYSDVMVQPGLMAPSKHCSWGMSAATKEAWTC